MESGNVAQTMPRGLSAKSNATKATNRSMVDAENANAKVTKVFFIWNFHGQGPGNIS